MSAEGYFIIAHCVNATSLTRAEVELEIASESIDGRWYTNEGMEVWPFWKQPIDFPIPAIPEGWIECLHSIVIKPAPTIPLADLLGLRKPKAQAEAPAQPVNRRF